MAKTKELGEYRVAVYAMDGSQVYRTLRIRTRAAARQLADEKVGGAGVAMAVIEGRLRGGIWIRLERILPGGE